MLDRVVGVVSAVVSPVIVVAGPKTQLPELRRRVAVVRDPVEGRGPLQGIAAGLTALRLDGLKAAFVTSCDIPLLSAAVVRVIVDSLGEADLSAVRIDGRWHPMAGVYRTALAERAQERVDAGNLRVIDFLEVNGARETAEFALRQTDPQLLSLMNVNTPEDYARVLELAFPQSPPSDA